MPENVSNALPEHLAERTTRRNEHPTRPDAEFVLCWLHHAIRADENPALDVALTLANEHNRPVLVYQGLAGRHRFNSDRHHRFILEGARDLAQQLAERDVAFAFNLPTDSTTPSPLRTLAHRAVAVVTEDFPAPPFPRWTGALARACPCACLAVDAACIMPVRSIGTAHTRAFKFRSAAKKAWRQRIALEHPPVAPTAPPFPTTADALAFEPFDLTTDLDDAISRCDIDHSIPAVTHLTGGATAANARWDDFVANHLQRYDKRRNDASDMTAVSGLSPYLHHGHIAPTRVAREADRLGGPGAEKFLDELLVWRELAHNFCANTPDDQLETLSALPDWAQQTLAEHATDLRDHTYTWEELARAVTDDHLWNAAQHSLLLNGELHNNIRMTWGKMIPRWTATPHDALRTLIDLNHRYALDGNNPNSYGGLLWCLGQFDRPFDPPTDITGTIRERSTDTHATRLAPDRYARAVARRHRAEPLNIAIIGAGVTGLAAARTLHDHRCTVTLFDRGRRAGGRATTRRLQDGNDTIPVDHGAPAFSVTDPRFGRYLRAWIEAGVCARWTHTEYQDGQTCAADAFVGTPTMDALSQHLAGDLTVRHAALVNELRHSTDGWELTVEDVQADRSRVVAGPFDAVILAMAPAQSRRLLTELDPALDQQLARISASPTWALMLELDNTPDDTPDVIRLDHPILKTLIRDDRKPGRPRRPGTSVWVAHTTPDWAADRLDTPRDDLRDELLPAVLDALAPHLDTPATGEHVRSASAHRWSLARTTNTIPDRALAGTQPTLIACGDGFGGSTIESAFLSGQAAAGRLLAQRTTRPPQAVTPETLFHAT